MAGKIKGKTIIKVRLNGTAVKRYEDYGLAQNPFPQPGRAQYFNAEMSLNKLSAPPIPQENAGEYIRSVLQGFTAEFIDLCVARFQPGAYVEFEVFW